MHKDRIKWQTFEKGATGLPSSVPLHVRMTLRKGSAEGTMIGGVMCIYYTILFKCSTCTSDHFGKFTLMQAYPLSQPTSLTGGARV
jgi:hypothetical protein